MGGSRLVLVCALLAGLALAVTLYGRYDLAELSGAVTTAGWGLAVVFLYRAVPVGLDALGWWLLLPPENRPSLTVTGVIRWISEAVNTLLPVAQIGGEVARVRLIGRFGVPGGQAGASVAVDVTLGVAGTALFSLAGVAALTLMPLGQDAAGQALAGLGIFAVVVPLLWAAQRAGLPSRLLSHVGGPLAGGAAAFDQALDELWRARRRLLLATGCRVLGSFALAGEVWLILAFLGHHISLGEALALESLTVAVRTAAFLVPGGLGVQEGALLLLGAALGLPAEAALAVALVKRVRELATGLPALALWGWGEWRAVAVRQ